MAGRGSEQPLEQIACVTLNVAIAQDDVLPRTAVAQRMAVSWRDTRIMTPEMTRWALDDQLVSDANNFLLFHERIGKEKFHELSSLRKVAQMRSAS